MTETTGCLESLVSAQLLETGSPGRYRFHDLVRRYASKLASSETLDVDAAVSRLLDFYACAAERASEAYEKDRQPADRATTRVSLPLLQSRSDALGWFDAERANLVAMSELSTRHGTDHAIRLSQQCARYLRSHYREALEIHQRACAAAHKRADYRTEAYALIELRAATIFIGATRAASHHYQQALACAEQAGDTALQARARTCLGYACARRAEYDQASEHLHHAYALNSANGDKHGVILVLRQLGNMAVYQGRTEDAIACYREALAITREIGDATEEANLNTSLGFAYAILHDFPLALHHHQKALRLFRKVGLRTCESLSLVGIANALRGLGQLDDALTHATEALRIAEQLSDTNNRFEAKVTLGRIHRTAGRPHDGIPLLLEALALARVLAQPADIARAHDALAAAYHVLGRATETEHHRAQAKALYHRLGMPGAFEVEEDMPDPTRQTQHSA